MTHRLASCRPALRVRSWPGFGLQYPAAGWRVAAPGTRRGMGTSWPSCSTWTDPNQAGSVGPRRASDSWWSWSNTLASFQSRSRLQRVMPRAVSDLLGKLLRQRPTVRTLSNGSIRSLRSSVVVGGRLSGCAGAALGPMTALLPRQPSKDLILRSTPFTTSPRNARLAKGIRSPVRASPKAGPRCALAWATR
jgi:hypothetical protein